ncbi:hypothetical protein Tco_1303750 [Tanacetum coccineum]
MNKKNLFLLKDMDQDFAHMVAASKVPMLKPENGATLPKTKIVEGVMTEMPITTAEEKAQRTLEVKTRSTLMTGIFNTPILTNIAAKANLGYYFIVQQS